jgi:hypothetical protein
MSFYYTQINENNICCGVSELAAEMSNPNLIRIDGLDISILGKVWNGSNWSEPPQEQEN